MRVNFFINQQNNVSFQALAPVPKKKYARINVSPEVVYSLFMQYGFNGAGERLGVSRSTVKYVLKKCNLLPEMGAGKKRLTKIDRIGLTVERVKKLILEKGFTRKELMSYYDISEPLMSSFFEKHKDEININQLLKESRKNIIANSTGSDDLSAKLGIGKYYANKLRRANNPEAETIAEEKRKNRIEKIMALYKSGDSIRKISAKTGWSTTTVHRDIMYYFANLKPKNKSVK